ncbi:MAG: J domain-containing protein [Bacteriovoracaceae bacterium]|nr:J domain-containing protein [Bacteriovoracaceae bacterium]
MLKINVIIKILSICVLAYVVSKLIAPFIAQALSGFLYGNKKKKNSDINFDHMIEQKKSMLRTDGHGPKGEALAPQSSRKNRTEEALHLEYTEISSIKNRDQLQDKRLQELKTFMAMIDSLQWGAGPELKEIANKLGQSIGQRIEEAQINQDFNTLIKREAFLTARGNLQTLSSIREIIECFTFTKLFLESSALRELQAKRWMMSPLCLVKGIVMVFDKKTGKVKLRELVQNRSPTLPSSEPQNILGLLKRPDGVLRKKLELLTEIKEEAELFHTLSPMPPLKGKNDKEGAFKSLGLESSATLDQIKKQYKKLARLKHPDRLKGKGIPEEFESIATENFTQIKDAYDILIKESK